MISDPENEKEISTIAEELYNYYKGHPRINTEIWLESLLIELSKSLKLTRNDIEELLEDIIRTDKKIPLENLSDQDKKELFREISEWLVAEGILKMIKDYDSRIKEDTRNGKLIRIDDIIKVSVIKELENIPRFENTDELKSYLMDNYLIDTDNLIGSGKRMNVYDFVPVSFPLPFPREDNLTKAIVFRYPNKFLVIRIMNNIYREFLSDKLEESEDESIKDFNTINPFFTYQKVKLSNDSDNRARMAKSIIKSGHLLKDHLTGRSFQKKTFSFIPPLIILKVKLQNSNTEEYVTIQQKIFKRGEISILDSNFKNDLLSSKSFRYKVKGFIKAFKRLFLQKGLMPDLIGSGNLLYNQYKNIYLVDINNVSREPQFEILANMLLLRDIKISIMEGLGIPVIKRISIKKLKELNEEKQGSTGLLNDFLKNYNDFYKQTRISLRDAEHIIDFENYQDRNLLKFLKDIRFLDDLNEPIFLHNLDKVYQIERYLISLKKGNYMPDDEFKPSNDPFYTIMDYKKGDWENKNTYGLDDMLENKNKGYTNWVSFYVMNFYNSFVSSRHTGGL